MPNSVVDFPWEKLNVIADTLVRTGPCVLHSITFNGMTAVGDVGIRDGIVAGGGTLIGTLILRSAVQVSCQPFTLIFDCEMANGIFIDYDGAFAGNFTVTFK